jgi:hypothetical protein
MPRRRRRAPVKRTRAGLRDAISELSNAMEIPLRRARGLADALCFVGYGLESVEDDGARPVLTLASALMDDLEALNASWEAMYDVAASGR